LSEVDRNPDPNGKQPPGRCLLEALRDRLDDVTRFAHDLRVPPTNNQAERDVRPAKTQQGGSQPPARLAARWHRSWVGHDREPPEE